jgi:PAS domain S-box-containing protein
VNEVPASRALKRGEEVRNEEMVIYRTDGTAIPVLVSAAPIRDIQGKITAAVVIFEDITERKKAEEALLYDEGLLKGFFDSPGLMRGVVEIIKNKDIRHIRDNVVTTSYVGLTPKDLEGKLSSELGEPSERIQIWLQHYKESEQSGKPITWEYADIQDNKQTWLAATVTYLGKAPNGNSKFTYSVLNVTERKKAEEALQESEQRWATTLASIGDAVIATDTSGKIMFLNGAAEELTGWKLSEASQKPVKEVFNIVNEKTRLEVENPIDRVLRDGIVVGLANHTVLIQKKGAEVPIDDSGAPIKDKEGKTTGVVLIFRNITERRRAEEATAKQAELIDLSPDAIIVRKLDGTITFWSKGAEKLYGWTKEEAVGQVTHNLFNTQFPQQLDEILAKLKADGKWSGEIVHTCKNGGKIVLQSYWLAKLDADGKIFELLESNVDITPRIELQNRLEESAIRLEEYASQMEELAEQRANQLKDAERLAAIGATAGMVGHDIRNPLQAITSDVFLAKSEIAETPDSEQKNMALESLGEIEKNIDYINKIVQDLQDYARPLNPKIEESDLKQIIEAMISKNGLPKNIKVKVKIEDKARKIEADSYYLNRILYNLVTNSVQAMPQGGKLTIEAYKEARGTLLSIKDTGVGIPKDIQEKMFTLMFTTKAKGQGFGLPVVKRMAESLGGKVTFTSEEGKGTTFTVCLPPQRDKR